MNIKNLASDSSYLKQCLEVIEDSFDYEAPYSFKNDFNTLIGEENLKNCFFIVGEKKEVMATLFTLPKKLTYKDYTTDVLFLGGIAVHSEWREKGLFKKLFHHVQKEKKDFSLYLLWSDLTGLYEKFSFYEFGIIQEIRSDPNNLKELKVGFNLESAKEHYQRLSDDIITVERSSKDWSMIQDHPSIQKYTRENGDSFLVHKGMDLQNVIHESYPLDMFNDTPFIKWNYLPELSTKLLLYMGFIKINNISSFSKFIKEISQNKIQIIKKENEVVCLELNNEKFELHEKDLIQGLWGPAYITELFEIVPRIVIFGFDAT